MHIPDQESRGHTLPTRIYLYVGLALMLLTALTVAASYVNWGEEIGGGFATNIIIALLIASAKAMLVMMYFMHMKYEGPLIWGFGIIYPIVIFAIMIGFISMDVFLRVDPADAPELSSERQIDAPVSQDRAANRINYEIDTTRTASN
ncbi:MAG: cytochrome C oxidase subunit IV family protein [Leptospiraceae bacterium]|nr:cytochrome C oxidase subunit IV family protein [Leptospiraceae bacterium]MCB1317941.1 cytochrome C oxidase subunit IV family protein [Leptospiraceae bacterium]